MVNKVVYCLFQFGYDDDVNLIVYHDKTAQRNLIQSPYLAYTKCNIANVGLPIVAVSLSRTHHRGNRTKFCRWYFVDVDNKWVTLGAVGGLTVRVALALKLEDLALKIRSFFFRVDWRRPACIACMGVVCIDRAFECKLSSFAHRKLRHVFLADQLSL